MTSFGSFNTEGFGAFASGNAYAARNREPRLYVCGGPLIGQIVIASAANGRVMMVLALGTALKPLAIRMNFARDRVAVVGFNLSNQAEVRVYDRGLNLLATATVTTSGRFRDCAYDSQGDLIVVGDADSAGDTVWKYAGDLSSILWSANFTAGTNTYLAKAVTLADSDSVVVTGTPSTNSDPIVTKFSSAGANQWGYTLGSTGSGTGIAYGPAGSVFWANSGTLLEKLNAGTGAFVSSIAPGRALNKMRHDGDASFFTTAFVHGSGLEVVKRTDALATTWSYTVGKTCNDVYPGLLGSCFVAHARSSTANEGTVTMIDGNGNLVWKAVGMPHINGSTGITGDFGPVA